MSEQSASVAAGALKAPEAGINTTGDSSRGNGSISGTRHSRIFAVELLRLLAIVGIAVFHTFLLTFEQIAVNGPHALSAAVQAGAAPTFIAIISSTPLVVWLISMLMFLGAWGNHIFFMISAFFLVPRLAERSYHKGFARDEWKPTAARIAKILAAVVFYVVVLVVVNRWVVPIQAVGGLREVVLSLEFVWLYVLFVLLAPFIAWCIERCRKKWCVALWTVALAMIYGLNVYVAISGRNFFDSLSVLDWRKQMSAVTYFASYICAGALGCAWQRWYGKDASAHDSAPLWLTRRFWAIALIALVAAAGCVVAFAAFGGHYGLLMVLSFKSTSVISFLLAVCSLMCAACPSARTQKRGSFAARSGVRPLLANMKTFCRRAVEALASGILGFYIVQALTYYFWIALQSHFADPVATHVASAFTIGGMSACAGWLVDWFLVEVVFSLAFVLLVCLIDRFVRQPLLRLIKLA
ncbi:acyltransferase family protein [Bifidobacterium sp. ESL0728]|uniref:acyltransferase family protein n=1 Tax=Bifidobacterium sp. ESL0728 TaxID=2983220 RepID=UPI0023F94216|nr:acyltransferase family protein [Bifidobacterium sp. ESL0728]WEV58735.1 acyltransferase family protein [Bifidobacterium sp. ESL0728]